jgi:glycosyltransferase involved in cell wall biosynthesis
MEPLISVIVPAYNIANYIERCIKSLLSQTYPRIEIIVVDDGSSDRTANLIDALVTTESRIKALHQQNSGVTIARLNGVAQASGEWIGFVDGQSCTNIALRISDGLSQ